MKRSCLALVLITGAAIAADLSFAPYRAKNLPKAEVNAIPRGFRLSFNNEEGKDNYAIAIADTGGMIVPAQHKLVMKLRGDAKNKNTRVDVHILTAQDGKLITHRARAVTGDGTGDRNLILGLDSDFHLADGQWNLRQIKVHLNGRDNPNGFSALEVRDLRIVAPDELGVAGGFVVIPTPEQVSSRRRPRAAQAALPSPGLAKPVPVFFDLDNEDIEAFISIRQSGKQPPERNRHDGFRGYLLKGAEGLVELVANPEQAEIIVYSRAAAAADVAHVHPGKKLLVYGQVADADVLANLPLQWQRRDIDDYVTRLPLQATTAGQDLLAGAALSRSAFACYFDLKPTQDAQRLIDFADQTPCVLRSADCMYVATGIGAGIIPDDQFYDRFLLQAILYLTRNKDALALLEKRAQALREQRQRADDELVSSVANAAGIPAAEHSEYQVGMSKDNFGRFGYSIGEGLCVGNLSSNTMLSNGHQNVLLTVPEQPGRRSLAVTAIDWVGKSYRVSCGSLSYDLQFSLLTPYVRYGFGRNQQALMLPENLADYAVLITTKGALHCDIRRQEVIYDRRRDGELAKPWLLLFQNGDCRPLHVVFSHQLQAITATVRDGAIEELRFHGSPEQPLGDVLCGWPWGSKDVNAAPWTETLPGDVLTRLDLFTAIAVNYPVGCDEIFRIDQQKQRVHIVQRTRFQPIATAWDITPRDIAVMPPLMAFAIEENLLVHPESPLQDLDLPSKYGPVKAVMDSAVLRYAIDLPASSDIILPDIDCADPWREQYNALFAGGVRWSWGGGAPADNVSPAIPGGGRGGDNISPFTWQFGLTTSLQGYHLLSPENRAKLRRRVQRRFIEPLDLFQYKNYARHRREPFSGQEYPVTFRSIYALGVNYAEDFGTGYQYGDVNEACSVITWLGELLADRFGLRALAETHWAYFKYVMRHQMLIDDWAYHAGSCREDGAGAWIDMLNGEYAGMLSYARLAALSGDQAEQQQALYRAAKKSVPTIARLRFHRFLGEPVPFGDPGRSIALVTGFNEFSGAQVYRLPLRLNSNIRGAMDLFDFSQGAPGSLYRLYDRYAKPEVLAYMRAYTIPAFIAPEGFQSGFRYLQPLAWFEADNELLKQWTDELFALRGERATKDWPGITVPYPVGLVMARKYNVPVLELCQSLQLSEAGYEPQERRLKLSIQADAQSRAIIPKPKSLSVNGRPQPLPITDSMPLPLQPGMNEIEALY
ncbi:MAG: hypothetical protein ACOX9E_02655 [Lentisphaeria bacterium]|jgi:hypothetical protein